MTADTQRYLTQYVRYGLKDDQARANVARENYIAAGGNEASADAALIAAYDAQSNPRAAKPHMSPLNMLIASVFVIILILALYRLAQVAVSEYRAWNAPADVHSTAQPIPTPNAYVNTATHQTTYAQPATPTYPLTTADGATAAWAPNQAGFAIGARHYRDLGAGYIELDDGTRLWLVAAEAPAPVEVPQAAEAAEWVQPVSELVAPTAQPQVVVAPDTGGQAASAGQAAENVSDILLREGK